MSIRCYRSADGHDAHDITYMGRTLTLALVGDVWHAATPGGLLPVGDDEAKNEYANRWRHRIDAQSTPA